jgi:hypothetical protein
MVQPAHADLHHQPVLGEDGGLGQPVALARLDRHPIDPVIGEEVDPLLPAARIQQSRLAVQQVFDFLTQPSVPLAAGSDGRLPAASGTDGCGTYMVGNSAPRPRWLGAIESAPVSD